MAVILLALLLIAATILIHYETLRLVSISEADQHMRPRMRMFIMLSAAIFSHLLQIAVYAAAFVLIEHDFQLSTITGARTSMFNDAFYFSITSYTSLGIGDIYPNVSVRLLGGIEALNGLVMITWTASMTYLHMERFWSLNSPD